MSDITKDFTDGEFAACSVINQLAGLCYENSRAKGFWSDHDSLLALTRSMMEERARFEGITSEDAEKLLKALDQAFMSQKDALIHSELGEATEAQRKDLPSDKIPTSGEVEEYADTIIRILDKCGRKRLPIGEAIVLKMRYNFRRPYMHGKQF